jgi:hypothetical protein
MGFEPILREPQPRVRNHYTTAAVGVVGIEPTQSCSQGTWPTLDHDSAFSECIGLGSNQHLRFFKPALPPG